MAFGIRLLQASFLWVVLSPPAWPEARELYRAEALLTWGKLTTPVVEQEVASLIRRRQVLIENLSAADFTIVPTPFGSRLDEPAALQKLRQEEHRKILAFIPRAEHKNFEQFYKSWLEEITRANSAFPLLPKPNLDIQLESREGSHLVTFLVAAPSPRFTLTVDSLKPGQDSNIIHVTWNRPPLDELRGQEPQPTTIRQHVEVSPAKKIEIWLRARDGDLPFRRDYVKLAELPLPDLSSE